MVVNGPVRSESPRPQFETNLSSTVGAVVEVGRFGANLSIAGVGPGLTLPSEFENVGPFWNNLYINVVTDTIRAIYSPWWGLY